MFELTVEHHQLSKGKLFDAAMGLDLCNCARWLRSHDDDDDDDD